jgi:hypothetical protein
MKTNTPKAWVKKKALEHFTEHSHFMFACLPVGASIWAVFFGTDTHYIELVIVIAVIVLNFSILALRSRIEENKELSLLRTFRTDELQPVKTGKEQRYNVEVAVIKDGNGAYFRENLERRFKKEPELKNLVLKETGDPHLRFRPVEVGSPSKDDVEETTSDFKLALDSDLTNSTAVVIVRTPKLEEKEWTYKALDRWAYDHSDVPILCAWQDNQTYPKNVIAEGFLRIPDDAKSLPWRLLQRAKDRAGAWRVQATYNRAMVINFLYLSLMVFFLGGFWLRTQKTENETVLKGMYEALETKVQYENAIMGKNGLDAGKIDVSYWFRHDGKPHVFVTTVATRWISLRMILIPLSVVDSLTRIGPRSGVIRTLLPRHLRSFLILSAMKCAFTNAR